MQLQNYFAQDKSGNALPGATVYVLLAGTATMATGLQDKNGNPKANPFMSDSQGLIQFAAENGDYDIRVVKGPHDYKLTSVRFEDSKQFRLDVADNTDPAKGAGMVGVDPVAPSSVGTTAREIFDRTINVLDVLSASEKADVMSRAGTININAKIQALLNAAPVNSRILFTNGVYLNSGAVGLTVSKALTLDFERGAVLKFDHNNATYVQTTASDISLINISIDGGSDSWVRTGNAAIRVRSDGVAVSNIYIQAPRVKNVAGAGILVGWSEEIGDVTILNPVVQNTQADGVSVAYNTRDASIISPRCYNTGDDGVSIVSYDTAANPVRRVEITDALSFASHARGLTVIGGEDIRLTGKSINATAQGVLVLQDVGTYNTFIPKRVELDVSVYNSAGIGIEIGRNAEDISGSVKAVAAQGTRGILIGSAVGLEPKRINLTTLSGYNCAGIGVELGRILTSSFGTIVAAENGTIGVLAANSTNISVGSITAYNNNVANTAGIDNIFYSGVTNFSIGSAVSTDDRGTPQIERTMDLATCTNGVIGAFNGVRGATVNTIPNIQGSNTNIRVSGEAVVKAGAPSVSEIPVRGFVIDTTNSRVYFSIAGVAKFAALT